MLSSLTCKAQNARSEPNDLDGLSKKKLFHANGEPNVQCFSGPGSMLCITELWVYFGSKALILCETKNRQKVVDSICESNIIPET